MVVISLFAGIGGFDLGFEKAGMRTVAVVERDKNCLKLLKRRFPLAEQFDDVRKVGRDNLPSCDVLCGGFPCQDLSAAGKRAGLSGERSGLFYEFARIIDERRPACVVWENVPGLFSSDKGRDFARVLLEMEKLGYSGAWRTFDARYFGVAQRRRRVFGVFSRGDSGAERCSEILALQEGVRGDRPKGGEEGPEIANALTRGLGSGGADDTRACAGHIIPFDTTQITHPENRSKPEPGSPCHSLARQGHAPAIAFSCKDSGADAGDLSPTLRSMNFDKSHLNGGGQVAVAASTMVRRLTPTECERLQGFEDGWTEGFSDSVRYRMLGNAVCVNVAEWIGKRIMRFAKELEEIG